jgi:large subunit ribosomal protein L16
MGGGKGNVEEWVAVVQPGRMLFELGGIPEDAAREAMKLASAKLPIDTQFVVRMDPITGVKVTSHEG